MPEPINYEILFVDSSITSRTFGADLRIIHRMDAGSCMDQPLVQSRLQIVGISRLVARSMGTRLEINPMTSLLRRTCLYLPSETRKTWPLDTSDLQLYSNPEAH